MANGKFEIKKIVEHIDSNSTVLDIGCADGKLLEYLRDEKNCKVSGVERDISLFIKTVEKGIPVIRVDSYLDVFSMYEDKSFDTVILSQTLKNVSNPKKVLSEVLRVAKRGIVSFPNFAHWRNRSQLFFKGHMPVSRNLPSTWYEATSKHYTTIPDFYELIESLNGTIEEAHFLIEPKDSPAKMLRVLPTWRAETVIAIISSETLNN